MATEIEILRCIDKYDRVGDLGLFQLLTKGRKDASGAFINGLGLSTGMALGLVWFVNMGRGTLIERRFNTIAEMPLEEVERLLDESPQAFMRVVDVKALH